MLIIDSAAALAHALTLPLDANLKRLLARYRDEFGGDVEDAAQFYAAEPGDTIADAEAAIGFPLTIEGEPTCDWTITHPGVHEVCIVLSDNGPASVLLVPDDDAIDPALLGLIRSLAAESGVSVDRGHSAQEDAADRA